MTDMSTSKLKFLLLLSVTGILVASSGCTFPTDGTGGGGPGLVIEEFATPFTTIESGEDVNLHLEVRNQGDYNGLFGTGAHAVVELMQIDPLEWGILPAPIIDLGTLLVPDIESQTQGGLKTADWQLIAPPLERGQRQTYTIASRVFYEYETKARKGVQFVTSEEMRRMIQNGQTFTSDPTTYTAGPINVEITTGNIVKATDWTNARFQLQIRITNAGNGQIRGRNYPIAIEVIYPQWIMPVEGFCPSQTLWGVPEYFDVPPGLVPPVGNFIYVWDGRTTDVTCEFEIVQPPSSMTKGNFEVNLGYIYSVDATTQVTVKGIELY